MQRLVDLIAVLGSCALAQASVAVDMVTVADPGNTPDMRYAYGTAGYGAVGYTYQIGKFEITAAQYCEFLNAVAAWDTYGLYNPDMWSDPWGHSCTIQRTYMGSEVGYSYTVAPDRADRPVDLVSWGDAARFCNWLTNGQPTGFQGLSTTEAGSYYINGATTPAEITVVTRSPDAQYVIPNEDEWYKAAYYDPAKPGGAAYWDYPTRSDAVPSNLIDPAGTNNANFLDFDDSGDGCYTLGAPYWFTTVGAFSSSPSFYGTYDQGGNVSEWNETHAGGARGWRGGEFGLDYDFMWAGLRAAYVPTLEDPSDSVGFRIALVPEPALACLAVAGALCLRVRRMHILYSPEPPAPSPRPPNR